MTVSSSEFLVSAFLILFIAFIVKYLKSSGRKFVNQIPGPPRLPFIGNYKDFVVPHEELVRKTLIEWPRIYGDRFGVSGVLAHLFVTKNMLDVEVPSCSKSLYLEILSSFLADPGYFNLKRRIRLRVLSSSVHISKGVQYELLLPWIGEGLLTATGGKWMRNRKLLTPSFHFKILEEFIPCFNQQSQTLVSVLKEAAADAKPLDICPYMSLCTLDVVCESVMGRRINAQRERTSDYVKAVYGFASLVPYRLVRPWLLPNIMWYLSPSGQRAWGYLRTLHGFTEQVIRERKAELAQKSTATNELEPTIGTSKKKPLAFLDLLLQIQRDNPGSFTDRDIRDETDTFMFEGHDTTAMSLSWTVWLLANNPDHQQRVMDELDSIFGDDKERDVTQDDLAQMKYLECCIKEALRLFPSVPFITRQLTSDLVLHDGLTVPSGMNVGIVPYLIHRNPNYFPEPEKYDPERFLPSNTVGRNPFAYIPFSAGPRNCIGQKFATMEEKIILSHLFRNFRIEPVTKEDDLIIMMELIIRSKNGLNVRLIPRMADKSHI